MSIRNHLYSITAWFAGLFKKDTVMTDETQAAAVVETPAADATPAAVVVAPVAVAAEPAPVAVVATPVDTDTLKSILAALGHDLEAVWDDAIALAKKAL
ncbi:hypothetical protein [Pseudomonas sp. RIT-To-2]|uniref:hypothetical protein n=1 Tax=Pseudomonas sp. RIT-To-2 TaxID=3462541 RepID=UPI0024131759